MHSGARIGFIGLGIMGAPMARNLLSAGYRVTVFNRSTPAIDELVVQGATAATSPSDAAAESDVLITMLPADGDVRSALLGPNGALQGAAKGMLLIDMSTVSPSLAQDLARAAGAQGVRCLDAPVSGGDAGARNATLSIMVGGEAEDFQAALPVLEALGAQVRHVGPHGAGQAVKASNQIVVGAVVAALSEALVLAEGRGVDPAAVLDVLGGGLAATRVAEVRRTNYLERDFTPGFRVRLHRKDLGIALSAGQEAGIELPVTATVSRLFDQLCAQGDGELDHTALISLLDQTSVLTNIEASETVR